MQHRDVMKQLQLYRVHSASNSSWDFLEYAQYCFNGARKPCIDINNIDASSRKLLNVMHYANMFLYNNEK